MGSNVRRRDIDNILGQQITSVISGATAGASIGTMLLRTSMAGYGGAPVAVSVDSTVIGLDYTAAGTNDASLDLPDGLYVVTTTYQVAFEAQPSTGYAKLEVSKNAAVIGAAVVSAAEGLGAGWPPATAAVWFRGGGDPIRGIGTTFADQAVTSEALVVTALRVA